MTREDKLFALGMFYGFMAGFVLAAILVTAGVR